MSYWMWGHVATSCVLRGRAGNSCWKELGAAPNSLQPTSDGLQPASNSLQPRSNGLQLASKGLQPKMLLFTSQECVWEKPPMSGSRPSSMFRTEPPWTVGTPATQSPVGRHELQVMWSSFLETSGCRRRTPWLQTMFLYKQEVFHFHDYFREGMCSCARVEDQSISEQLKANKLLS